MLVPEAVFRELTTNITFKKEADIVKSSVFIKTSSIQNRKSLEILQAASGLDDGNIIITDLQNEFQNQQLIKIAENPILNIEYDKYGNNLLITDSKGNIIAVKVNDNYYVGAGKNRNKPTELIVDIIKYVIANGDDLFEE